MKVLVVLVSVALLLLTLFSPAYVSIQGASGSVAVTSTATATPASSSTANASNNQGAFYLASGISSFYNESWNLSAAAASFAPPVQTSIAMKSPIPRTGYFLFEPGVSNSGFLGGTMPKPGATSQYGWLSTNSLNESIPAGAWNVSISVSLNEPQKPLGTAYLGAAIFGWNVSSQQFTEIMTLTNDSFNFFNASNGTHVINMSNENAAIAFPASSYLFAEFYISVTSFSSSVFTTVTLNLGNTGASSCFIKYPYFGWLNGTVNPSSASITLNGTPLSLDGNGGYSLTLAPGNYTLTASAAGYASNSAVAVVRSGVAENLNLALKLIESISFVESGLPASTNWSVTFNGVTSTTNDSLIVFHEVAGSYNYSIGTVSGFRANISQGILSLGPTNQTVNVTFATAAASGNPFTAPGGDRGLFLIVILLILLLLSSVLAVSFYLKTRRMANGHFTAKKKKEKGVAGEAAADGEPAAVNTGTAAGAAVAGAVAKEEGKTTPAQGSTVEWGSEKAEEILELGSTFAFFEEKAEKSIMLFEAGLKRGLKGLCFTREFPEKLTQKHDLKDATVIWISNVWAENSIRPNNLEKINLLSEECLATAPSVIFVDGLESLITNNGFLSVIKMMGFLRDAAAVHHSVLIVSVNRRVITEGEIGLLKREVDRVVE